MTTSTHLRRCLPLVLLLAACPSDKGDSGGESTAAATDTTATGSATTATETSGREPTTGGCAPVSCDQCPAGCVGQLVCLGSQASCECDCEDPSATGAGESTGTLTGSTGATGTGGDSTGATGGTTGDPAIVCGGDMPVFPEFDRSCAATSDCALVLHQLDCCGSLAALGISADVARLFAAAEAVCRLQYPECDCAPKPTVADDGNSSPDTDAIAVTCLEGQCRSVVP